jgi:AraC family transcriptional regulator
VHIQQHLDETIELDELAHIAHFSPYHFHRIFRGMVGESLMEHVRRLRLERAAHRLKFTDKSVTNIAFDAGYETLEAFSRVFRTMFDESPSQFREAHQALPFRSVPSGIHFVADGKVPDLHAGQDGKALDVRIEWVATTRVAFIRHTGPYDQVGITWGRLMSWAGRQGLLANRPRAIGVVHDDAEVTVPNRLRYDACLALGQDFRTEGEIGVQEIGGESFAIAKHRGPYNQLGDTYSRLLGQWMPANGREPKSAPALEVYLNSPNDTPPADLVTEISIPLAD